MLELLIPVKKCLCHKVCNFLLFTWYIVLLSIGIWSYFTEGDVCRKMRWMYLSIVEEYFCIEVMHNLGITLMNNTSPRVFLLILSIINIAFSSVFKDRTNSCLVSWFLYPLIVCFQIIVPKYYNYYINVSPIPGHLFLCRGTIQ